tara:strand:+ start:453 stop:719 length:267 start_codon:yes stop_codon:yes gene_type:complete
MRALYLELLRTTINTIVCILLLGAGIELQSNYLIIIAILTWLSKLIAMTERRTTWNATKKRGYYREQFREGTEEAKDSAESMKYFKQF